MFAIYLGATAADFLSSLNFPPGFVEENPFARHSNGQFWPAHALIQNGVNSLEHLLVAAGIYYGFRLISENWAAYWPVRHSCITAMSIWMQPSTIFY